MGGRSHVLHKNHTKERKAHETEQKRKKQAEQTEQVLSTAMKKQNYKMQISHHYAPTAYKHS